MVVWFLEMMHECRATKRDRLRPKLRHRTTAIMVGKPRPWALAAAFDSCVADGWDIAPSTMLELQSTETRHVVQAYTTNWKKGL
jgi:hypothetical protein